MRIFSETVTVEYNGMRLERFLKQAMKLSVTRIKRAKFLPEGITVDGERAFTNRILKTGEKVVVNLPEQDTTEVIATEGAVSVLYEDDWLMIVNKPAGVSCHPGPGHFSDTLGNYLTWRAREHGEELVLRFVNRLDIGTSGLLLVAKRAEIHERMQMQLHTNDFVREYIALTEVRPEQDAGVIEKPVGKKPGTLNEYGVLENGKYAKTTYQIIQTGESWTMWQLRLQTGRTHQIRIHLSSIGCPLIGDREYGGNTDMQRPALHSWKLAFAHPVTGVHMAFRAPLPDDFLEMGVKEAT